MLVIRTLVPSFLHRAALLLLVAVAAPAAAQSLGQGSLTGLVRDAAGRPIADAEVRLEDPVSGTGRSILTARDGTYRFGLLGPATYDVVVEALGYRPVRHIAVGVSAGAAARLVTVLRAEAPPVVRIDTLRSGGARPEPTDWLVSRGYGELVGGSRLIGDVVGLATVADAHAVEGLPWRLADVVVDGARVGGVGALAVAGTGGGALPMPLRATSGATVGGTGFDVEMTGTGVGINARSLRGGVGAATGGSVFGGTSDIGASFVAGGPIQRDTAFGIIGVDYQRAEVARPAFLSTADAEGAALVTAAAGLGGDLTPYSADTPYSQERIGAFGRLDWQAGDRYAIAARGGATRLLAADPALAGPLASALGSRHEATIGQVAVNVLARLSPRASAELRVSGDFGEASGTAGPVPLTAFAGRGLTLGGGPEEPFSDARTSPRVTSIVHYEIGAHRFKVGLTTASHRFEQGLAPDTRGAWRFGDAADFAAENGAWRGVAPTAGAGNFRMSERAWFLQDSWQATEGLAVTFGLRFDATTLPVEAIEPNARLLATTGLDNSRVRRARNRTAPRLGIRWELGAMREWVVEGGAGVYHDLPERRDVAQALTFDRGAEVRSGLGVLAGWPDAPLAAAAPTVGSTVALLGPGFEGPRTRRLALSLARALGAWTLYAKGTYRHTDQLARRTELNAPLAPVGVDQFGRPLYGTLRRVGSLLAAEPGSNRRFAGFDELRGLEVTGFSEFLAATMGVERVTPAGVSVGVHYTFSRTEDNVPGVRDRLISPFPAGLEGADWREGTADTDAPHRLLAALEWSGRMGRIGAIYRVRSGEPFTAGFRDGVDANGDGVTENDPAFVSGSLAGMGPLLDEWSCLRDARGGFARRNACRGEMISRLDLRAAILIGKVGGTPLELVLDALDLLPAESGPVDRALLLVDRAAPVVTDPFSGVTTVPLVVNPAFGRVLADRATGMLFRLGLRVGR